MKKNSEVRKKARKVLKQNYFTLMFVCLIMMIFAGTYVISSNGINNILRQDFKIESINLNKEVDALNNSNLDVTSTVLKMIFHTDNIDEIYVKESVTAGFFRIIFDGITHVERFLFKIVKGILDVFVNENKTLSLVIIVLLLQFIYRVFISKPMKVCQSRVFLESRLYPKTQFKRFAIFKNFKSYMNVVKTIFLVDLYQILWDFTIVGGIIKRYSYRLVPLIMAENQDVKTKDAINLSRKMMNGYKWQMFKLDLSFTLYVVLNIVTMGFFGIIVTNPYYTASITEFYSSLKEDYIKNFHDEDYIWDKNLLSNESNLDYYPGVVIKEKKQMDETFNYYQKYPISSMILMFFTFSFLGWVWEVTLHLFRDGVFINRGVLHGPWLPIYGSGGVLILFLLFLPKKFKKYTNNPVITFFVVVLICGLIEYGTSVYLEMAYGLRWWDYTGNFLNINGKVCFEGLMFFGIGGCIFLYIVAPFMQKQISKLKPSVRNMLCWILVILFLIDVAYSSFYPNIGSGITHGTAIEQEK